MPSSPTLLYRLLGLELAHPSLSPGSREDEQPADLVDDLDLARRQQPEQGGLLPDLNEPAVHGLGIALNDGRGPVLVTTAIAVVVPRRRENVGEVVGEGLGLAEGFDEVRLQTVRVEEEGGELTDGVVRGGSWRMRKEACDVGAWCRMLRNGVEDIGDIFALGEGSAEEAKFCVADETYDFSVVSSVID